MVGWIPQIFHRLVFLVRVRGTTLHGGLVVRRSLSQSLPNDALDARPRSVTVAQEEFGRQ